MNITIRFFSVQYERSPTEEEYDALNVDLSGDPIGKQKNYGIDFDQD
jgi:hypothetical protein